MDLDLYEENQPKQNKKAQSSRKKGVQNAQFDTQITLHLEEFFRYFNYYYPGKNKDQIINKSLTGNTLWMTIDALYYPQQVEMQVQKISTFRKKSNLKNGTYPPTKDPLQEQKFILFLRKIILSKNIFLTTVDQVRNSPISEAIQYLQTHIQSNQSQINTEIGVLCDKLKLDNQKIHKQLQQIGLPILHSAKLFAYESLQKQVIAQSVNKAMLKEKQPRCDFCFIKDKQLIKCRFCDLHTHASCFIKANRQKNNFVCDQCERHFPEDLQCQLCPLKRGRYLQLQNVMPKNYYHFQKGDSNLKFKIKINKNYEEKIPMYIHVSCFVLHPECTYNINTNKVQGFHLIDRNRKNAITCASCGSLIGLTVSCYNESCRRAYHPECAKNNNLTINVIKANNKALLQIYCERHKKPESYEYLKDSVHNRIKQLRKFYEALDYELKRNNPAVSAVRLKRSPRVQQFLRGDKCLQCGQQNNFQKMIVNCRRCYGWYHNECSSICLYCQL